MPRYGLVSTKAVERQVAIAPNYKLDPDGQLGLYMLNDLVDYEHAWAALEHRRRRQAEEEEC